PGRHRGPGEGQEGVGVERGVVGEDLQHRLGAGDFVAMVRDRVVTVLAASGAAQPDPAGLARCCELALRLALSCVAAPPPGENGVAELVRGALDRQLKD
ncbi:hypothetical protein ACWEGM_13920, partial [Streptomyces nigra]